MNKEELAKLGIKSEDPLYDSFIENSSYENKEIVVITYKDDKVDDEWNKTKNKKRISKTKEIIETPISTSIPFRTPNKIKSLYPNLNVKQYDSCYYNFKKSKSKYQLRTFSSWGFEFVGDIFFTDGNKAAFLILIETNTRYVYAEQLGYTKVKKCIDVDMQKERIELKYTTKDRKSVDELIKAFDKILDKGAIIQDLKFDGEPAIRSKQFKDYLHNNFINLIDKKKQVGTSLCLIDRFCRTIRDMAFTSKTQLLSQDDMDKLVNLYNRCRHKTLSDIILNADETFKNNPYNIKLESYSIKERYPNGISPQNMKDNKYLESIYISECRIHNKKVMANKDFDIKKGTLVRILEKNGKFTKKRGNLSNERYTVIRKEGVHYILLNNETEETIRASRYEIKVE